MTKNRMIVFCALAVLYIVTAAGGLAPLGMEEPAEIAFVVLVTSAVLWISEAVPLFVTSLLILLLSKVWLEGALGNAGKGVSGSYFTEPFFSDVILLFLGGFVLSAALHKYRIDADLARRIIARTGRSIPLLLAGIMGTTAFLSMWLSNTATTAMMLALCLPVIEQLPKGDRYRIAILLGIPFAANVGGIGTPIGTPPNAIALQYMRQSGHAPTFGEWMALGVPLVIVLLAIVWGVLMLLYRGQAKSIEVEGAPRASVYTPKALFALGISVLTAVGWMTGALHGLSTGTVALIPVVTFFGARILTVQDLRTLSWDVLLVMGGGLCLGKAVIATGLDAWFVAQLPLENTSPLLLALLLGAVACLMSSLMSHTATSNLILPLAVGIGAQGSTLVAVAFCCSIAMALPISTPPNALAFSSGEIEVKDMLRPGLVASLAGLVLIFTLCWWWWKLLGVL